jgi:hypothetical protein
MDEMGKLTEVFTDNKVVRLGVLWTLLNFSTEIDEQDASIKIMEAIEKKSFLSPKTWNSHIKIVVDDVVIFELNK